MKINRSQGMTMVFSIVLFGCISSKYTIPLQSIDQMMRLRVVEKKNLSEFGDTLHVEITNISENTLTVNPYAFSHGPIKDINGVVQYPKTIFCFRSTQIQTPITLLAGDCKEVKMNVDYLYFYDLDSTKTWSIFFKYENYEKRVDGMEVLRGYSESDEMQFRVVEKISLPE